MSETDQPQSAGKLEMERADATADEDVVEKGLSLLPAPLERASLSVLMGASRKEAVELLQCYGYLHTVVGLYNTAVDSTAGIGVVAADLPQKFLKIFDEFAERIILSLNAEDILFAGSPLTKGHLMKKTSPGDLTGQDHTPVSIHNQCTEVLSDVRSKISPSVVRYVVHAFGRACFANNLRLVQELQVQNR